MRIAGICGRTRRRWPRPDCSASSATTPGLLSLAALRDADDDALLAHCRAVAEVIPLVGFYLQPAVGGRVAALSLLAAVRWRSRTSWPIKIAPFNRYQTLDVVRAVAESGRDDVALYTGNDDNIVLDLLTPFRFSVGGRSRAADRRRPAGPLGRLDPPGRGAARRVPPPGRRAAKRFPRPCSAANVEVTDCNAAFFDAANGFAGCIAGLHEVLRRQGLLPGIWCLDRANAEPGQREEIDRVYAAYPHLNDDAFVAEHRDEWLSE